MQVWAIPLGFEVFGQEIGDHTWVASNEGFCEGCRFGTVSSPDPFYCSSNRWSGGTYHPPGSPASRKLCEGPASRSKATCMAGAPYQFMGIPSQSGIVYAINGVCHTLTNRILYPTDLTAAGANGYWFIQATYGTYGTTIPWGFIPPLVSIIPPIANPLYAVALAFQVGILIEWGDIRGRCGTDALGTPPPTDNEASRLLKRIQALHAQPPLRTPEVWTAAAYDAVLQQQYAQHMAEVDLVLEYRGRGIEEARLEALRSIWADVHTPPAEAGKNYLAAQRAVQAEAPRLPMTREDVWLLAHTMNLKAGEVHQQIVEVLGPEDYQAFHGHAPDAPFLLVDPTILAGASTQEDD